MGRDNIPGVEGGTYKGLFPLPGKVIQWFMYMMVGNLKGYGQVRQQTRLARSPFMTYVYSLGAWILVISLIIFWGLSATGLLPVEFYE